MEVIKKDVGEYAVTKGSDVYRVSKDSVAGKWYVFCNKEYIISRKTKKECLDFIEQGNTVNIMGKISVVPNIGIDTYFLVKTPANKGRLWSVDDIVYSVNSGNWKIRGSYYNNSIDEGSYTWDYADFLEECEIIPNKCQKKV